MLQETSEAYVQEIEVISEAFEEIQKQNQRLLQQMAERDEVSNQLVTERIKSGHAAAAHKQEQAAAAAARQRAEQTAALLQERCNDLQTCLQVCSWAGQPLPWRSFLHSEPGMGLQQQRTHFLCVGSGTCPLPCIRRWEVDQWHLGSGAAERMQRSSMQPIRACHRI